MIFNNNYTYINESTLSTHQAYKMSVIVYTAKNYYNRDGKPTKLVHKIYPTGEIKTIEENKDYYYSITRWKKDGDLYISSYYKGYDVYDVDYERRTYKNNELHGDDDEPAVDRSFDGYTSEIKEWYKEGKLHREYDMPAYIANYEKEDVYIREIYNEGELISEYRG